jgi:hypothetical protein
MLGVLMLIRSLSILLSKDQKPFRPFQHVHIEGQTNNASQVLEALCNLIPAKIDQDSIQDPPEGKTQ